MNIFCNSVLLLEAVISLLCPVLGQEYGFPGGVDNGRYIPDYQRQQNQFINPTANVIPFRQAPQGFQRDSYLPQRDLQTSDLPLHLQQTLPQYRFTTKSPPPAIQYNFQSSPAAFRPPQTYQNIIPSTHRPNYSHLFSQNHNHDPSQTETFLGEITIQNPVEFPPRFGGGTFQPVKQYNANKFTNAQENVNQNLDYYEKSKVNENAIQFGSRQNNILNHRTRIFAPDNSQKSAKTQVKDYFVNTNGDVFASTKSPATTTETPFNPTPKSRFNLEPENKENPVTPKNTFDLESLLEEPIKESDVKTHDDDDVEVIKSKELNENDEQDQENADYDYESEVNTDPTINPEHEEHPEHAEEQETAEKDNNEVNNEDYEEESEEVEEKLPEKELENNSEEVEEKIPKDKLQNVSTQVETTTHNSSQYEVLTMKPSAMVKDDNFREFIDTVVIDTTTEEIPTTTEELEEITTNTPVDSQEKTEEKDSEFVVSVVTTKSVINNTVISTPPPQVTEQITIKPEENGENSTDTWVVVASVQTSRSVSGARYLPSSIVEQEERVKLLNEHSEEDKNNSTEVKDSAENIEKSTEDVSNEEQVEDTETTTITPSSTVKQRTSTESLIDKLDRVQSDLSSGLLTNGFKNEGNNIAVIKENMQEKLDITTMINLISSSTEATISTTKSALPPVNIRKFSPYSRSSTTQRPKLKFDTIKQDDLTGLLPPGFKPKYQNKKTTTTTTTTTEPSAHLNRPQGDQPSKSNKAVLIDDVSAFLPPGYKPEKEKEVDNKTSLLDDILGKLKPTTAPTKLPKIIKTDDVSAFLPPGYKLPKTTERSVDVILAKAKPVDDISALLPPGYKQRKSSSTTERSSLLVNAKQETDISHLLPPGYKPPKTTERSKVSELLAKAKPVDDISALLPPGYKPSKENSTKSKNAESLLKQAEPVDISAFLPPGYKSKSTTEAPVSKENTTSASVAITTTKSSGFKVVFPSRPGSNRKQQTRTTTTAKNLEELNKPTVPTIHKGWPSRATTEFTGWPTPSTTPISIEKLLEAARTASTSSSTVEPTSGTTRTTTTTTTTTTTPKPTTPGICKSECDLAGTIKLVGGAKWVPELLDRNTKEWQILANEVQTQLDEVFTKSSLFNKWYKKVRIDGFSKGSVLVDYLVELNELGRQINTMEIKNAFHETLTEATKANSNREGKSLNETKLEGNLSLGSFIVDPKYTDFIVLPKQVLPTVGYAEDNVLLPQWAIAVIVIGLASLLFVIIFGVTVLVNRQKSAKKKTPTPLTEDMLNELNKNHMGGFDNYGADDLYNMEDVWNDRSYEQKIPKKRSSGSIHDNSMSNLYDSWRSEWNGYYYNAYYGNNPGSSHSGYGRRRSDYDTNF